MLDHLGVPYLFGASGSNIRKVLDDLLGVFSLAGTRFSTMNRLKHN